MICARSAQRSECGVLRLNQRPPLAVTSAAAGADGAAPATEAGATPAAEGEEAAAAAAAAAAEAEAVAAAAKAAAELPVRALATRTLLCCHRYRADDCCCSVCRGKRS